MKRKKIWSILMLMVMALPMNVWGQDASQKKTFYCQFWADNFYTKLSTKRFYAGLNNGRATKESCFVCNENKEPVVFESTIAIFNYVSNLGWVYIEKVDPNLYLFKKEAETAEEAYKSLNALTIDEIKEAKK